MQRIFTASAWLLCSSMAMAEDEPIYLFEQGPGSIYISGGGGVSGIHSDEWKFHIEGEDIAIQPEAHESTVGTVSGAIGYEFDTLPVRLEATYRWFSGATYTLEGVEFVESEVDTNAGLFNVYWDWRNSTEFTPYIGAGIGFYVHHTDTNSTNISPNIETVSHDTTGLAWAANLGFRYDIGPNWFLDVRAEYMDLGHAEFYEDGEDPVQRLGNVETGGLWAISGLVNLTYEYDLGQ